MTLPAPRLIPFIRGMKLPRLYAVALLSTLLALPAFADDDKAQAALPADLTLEDIIFDAQYIQKLLGPNTLVAPAKDGTIPTEAILKAGLDKKTKIFALPDGITTPALKSSIPPVFPRTRSLSTEGITARFLAYVGADGNVKCLYCYETTDQIFAIAAADAVIKWRYAPTKIGQTAVPIVLPVDVDFSESVNARHAFRGPRNPLSVQGNPTPPKSVRPSVGAGAGGLPKK